MIEAVVEKVKDVVTPPPTATLSTEERAAKLGFAKHLPADAEMVMSVYNVEQAAEDLKAVGLFKYFAEMGSGLGMEFEEDMLEEDIIEEDAEQGEDGFVEGEEGFGEASSPWTLFGQEITLAMGQSAGEQTGHLLTASRRIGYFQARALGKAAQSYAKSGNMEDFTEMLIQEMETALPKNLLDDSESGLELLEKAQMPPLYIAFRVENSELDEAAQLVAGSLGMFAMFGEMAAPVEFETGGGKFAGYKLLGEEIAKVMTAERESMDESLGVKNVDGIIAAMEKKNLIVASGTVGDYVVMLIGGSEDSLKLADDLKGSLVASGVLDFTDTYADKKLLMLIQGEKELWDTVVEASGGLSSYALGLRDGIASGGGLGETRDIEAMLQILAEREDAMLVFGSSKDLGLVAFAEEGLKIEAFGGYDKGGVDWGAKTQLSHLGESGDNMLFLSVPSNAAYDEKMGDYLEVIVETMYAATVKFAELEIDAPELEQMSQFTQMFNAQFREDLVGLYSALSGSMSDGLGNEMAFVMDLRGNMPAIPGLPQKVVDEAKVPRITMLAPVKDRAELKKSWEKVNTHSTALLAVVSEMTGEKIPMQKPISSDKDNMTTWFFSFPFFQDDFLPSVTLSDNWFAASTSKIQATDLMSKAAAGGAEGEGIQFRVNFNVITTYAEEMLAMAEKNAEEIFPEESALDDFNTNKEKIKSMIMVFREFESLDWSARKENGTIRNSIHFRMK